MLVAMSILIASKVFGLWLSVVSLVSIMPLVPNISNHILMNTASDITIEKMNNLCLDGTLQSNAVLTKPIANYKANHAKSPLAIVVREYLGQYDKERST